MSFFKKIWHAIKMSFMDQVPVEASLDYDAKAMMEGLNDLADATAFAMARADEKSKQLKQEVQNYEEMNRIAKQFLNDGKAEEAKRCIERKIDSETTIKSLKKKKTRPKPKPRKTRQRRKPKLLDRKFRLSRCNRLPNAKKKRKLSSSRQLLSKQGLKNK